MADGTKIEWTDATWNPITGCSVVSPGCTNCYAMKLAGTRMKFHWSREGLTRDSKAGPVWTGEVRFNDEWLTQPLRWAKARLVFVCAHGDLFAEGVPDAWIDRVFAVMALAPRHTFQVLTKRADRMRTYLSAEGVRGRIARAVTDLLIAGRVPTATVAGIEAWPVVSIGDVDLPDDLDMRVWPLPNVWAGVSVEDQDRARERVPVLVDTPAAVRWISAEPLLGPVDLTDIEVGGDGSMDALKPRTWGAEVEQWRGSSDTWQEDFLDWYSLQEMPADSDLAEAMHPTLDWIVVGGESGDGARPMHPDWARSLRDQCAKAGVPFLFKQWGEYVTEVQSPEDIVLPGTSTEFWRDEAPAYRVGKKAAGRLLDSVQHDGYPEARS